MWLMSDVSCRVSDEAGGERENQVCARVAEVGEGVSIVRQERLCAEVGSTILQERMTCEGSR